MRSVHTNNFPQLLAELGISLLVTTYQSGRLIVVRAEDATHVNTHFRVFKSPMGLAIGRGRFAQTEQPVHDAALEQRDR